MSKIQGLEVVIRQPALKMQLSAEVPVSVIGFPTSVVDGSDSTKLFFDSPQINTVIKP